MTLQQALRRIEDLEGSLKVIYTWATFNQGSEFNRQHVINLCKRTLKPKKGESK